MKAPAGKRVGNRSGESHTWARFDRPRVSGSRGPALRLLAVLALALAAILALTATPALAATGYKQIGEIAGTGTGPFGSLRSESIATVPNNGHILVADSSDGLVYDFSSPTDTTPVVWNGSGTPAGSFGGGLIAVAVDHSTGDVYVSDATHAVIDKFDEDGNLIAGFGSGGALSGSGTPAGSFAPNPEQAVLGIAVDQATGGLFVLDMNHEVTDIFSPAGGYEGQIPVGPAFSPFADGLAIEAATGDVYVSNGGADIVFKFGPAGELLQENTGAETPAGSFGEGHGRISVAADASSEKLYVSDTAHGVVDAYGFAGTYTGAQIAGYAGTTGFEGLGVDETTGDIYAADGGSSSVKIFETVVLPDVTTEPATQVTTAAATLNGSVNPLGIELEECFFEYGESTAYGETAACEQSPAAIGAGAAPVPVSAAVEGLEPGKTYHFRLVAVTENGVNKNSGDRSLFTGVTIESTSVSQVSATAAKLEAEFNPHGTPARYHFEYGLTSTYESSAPVPDATSPASNGAVGVAAFVQGLQPGATYHYRIVAANGAGLVAGPDQTFSTPLLSSFTLPDSRAWELVSPPDKRGYPLAPLSVEGSLIQTSANGDAFGYVALGPITGEAAGTRAPVFDQLLSRHTATGWSTTDITPSHEKAAGIIPGETDEYRLFSSDLSRAVVMPEGLSRLAPYATEKAPYLREPSGAYRPLVVGCPAPPEPCPAEVAEHANVPPGTVFGPFEPEVSWRGGLGFVGADPDFHHIILESDETPDSLVPGFEAGGKSMLYEWTEAGLELVSILPNGRSTGEEGLSASLGNNGFTGNVRNAVSADGNRVVFEARGNGGETSLQLRQLSTEETVQIAPPGIGEYHYQAASADDSKIFFTSSSRLTPGSGAGPGSPDLYICEVIQQVGHLACSLKDLSRTSNPGESANVLGSIVGASTGGSNVYFVATGVLADNQVENGAGQAEAQAGKPNLYQSDEGHLTFIATLGADSPDWGDALPGLQRLTARVSPDGRYLAFMSQRSLTGYDSRDALSGERDQEVYLYDSNSSGGQGRLICASCDPSGARPRGIFVPETAEPAEEEKSVPLVDRQEIWKHSWLSGSVPGWTPTSIVSAQRQPRYLSDSGRLFFNSTDALVPQDSNGVEDVYEYQPPGVGSCTAADPTFSARSEGCVGLISSGTSSQESVFLDASETGNDAFFLTAARLSERDADSALDVYDASVGGSEPPPVASSTPCSGEACQVVPSPPSEPGTASSTYVGPPNPKARCAKGRVYKGGKCVKGHARKKQSKKHKKGNSKKSHKQGSAKKHKRANSNRGGAK